MTISYYKFWEFNMDFLFQFEVAGALMGFVALTAWLARLGQRVKSLEQHINKDSDEFQHIKELMATTAVDIHRIQVDVAVLKEKVG